MWLLFGQTGPTEAPWWKDGPEDLVWPALVIAALMGLAKWQWGWIKNRWERWRQKRRHIGISALARCRQLLIDSMLRVWIEGYLRVVVDPSVVANLPVAIEIPTTRPGVAGNHRRPWRELVDVWDSSARRKLRLIGGWGTGKTVHLLRLAEVLLSRAQEELGRTEAQRSCPIPVVLNVSNWTDDEGTFDRWALKEITRRHRDVDFAALEQLFTDGELVLLLDGVDEHPNPQACAQAIYAMLDATRALQVVVAYRAGADEEGRRRQQWIDAHLGGLDPVEIQPLRRQEVDCLLRSAGDEWAGVRRVIAANEEMWDPLIRRPVLLAAIMRAFRGQPAQAIPELHGTVEERQAQIYDAYLAAAVHHRPQNSGRGQDGWSVQQVRHTLAWLADTADRCDLGSTIYLEQVAPNWLPTSGDQARVRRQAVGGAFLAVLLAVLLAGLVVGLLAGPLGGLAAGLIAVVLYAVAFGASDPADSDSPIRSVRWSFQKLREEGPTILFGALVGALVLGLGVGGGLIERLYWLVAAGLLLVGIGGLSLRPAPLGSAAYPALLRRALLQNLVGGLVGGLLAGQAAAALAGLLAGLAAGLAFGLVVGLAGGSLPALIYWITHRALRHAGLFPGPSLRGFLEWCADHRGPLLLRVGFGYRFLHPTFQAHLAEDWRHPNPAAAVSTSRPSM